MQRKKVLEGCKGDKTKRNDSKGSREINRKQFPFPCKKIMGYVYMKQWEYGRTAAAMRHLYQAEFLPS
jgi:hypothetical protein